MLIIYQNINILINIKFLIIFLTVFIFVYYNIDKLSVIFIDTYLGNKISVNQLI